MIVSVIGLGLIGGSLAKDLRSQLCITVVGVDNNEKHQQEAMALGLVDKIVDLKSGVEIADVVIITTPVDVIEVLLPNILDLADESKVIIDAGSTKAGICSSIINHKYRGRFVAAHPLAGTEFSGPTAALKGLYHGKKNIICDRHLSDHDAVEIATNLFSSVGMNTYYMNSTEHDRHLAYVSHLSHVTSFTLGLTVLDIEKDEKQIFNLASTGFESTARLAKSNPETWAAIFDKNDKYLVEALDGYIGHLKRFRDCIAANDLTCMKTLMTEANEIKRVLNQDK